MNFTGKTVIITGAGSGIGAVAAASFAQAGARVVIADIRGEAAQAVADTVPGSLAVAADVSDPDSVRQLVAATIERFTTVDVLINNAMTCSETPFLTITPEEMMRDIRVDLLGPMLCTQAVLGGMIQRGSGVIINVASVNGLAHFGNEAYSAAKAGVLNFTKSIAVQFGHAGVRCNAVAPGTVATQYWAERQAADPDVFEKAQSWYPLGRVGTPQDVVEALLFLASDRAAWITGETLTVDGGLMAGNLQMAKQIVLEEG